MFSTNRFLATLAFGVAPLPTGALAQETHSRTSVLILLALALGGLTTPAMADESPKVGDRVRITAPKASSDAFEGTLTRINDKSLTILSSADKVSREIPLSIIESVEIARGKTSRMRGGAIAGAAIGGGLGLMASNPPSSATKFGIDAGSMLVGVAAGGAIGALVGGMLTTDQWIPVSKEGLSVRVQTEPGPGASVRLRLSF